MEPLSTELTVEQALRLASDLHQAGHYSQAKEIYQKILAVEPAHSDALQLMGVIAIQEKDYKTAIRLIAAAIELRPDIPVYYCNLASALHASHQYDDAVTMYRHALQLKPDYPDACFNLGNTLQIMGQFEDAMDLYRQALALKPDYAEAMHSIGCILQTLDNYSEAIEWHRRALALEPNFEKACFMLGKALFKIGRVEESLPWYVKHKNLLEETPENSYLETTQYVLPLMSIKAAALAGYCSYHAEIPEEVSDIQPPAFLDVEEQSPALPGCSSIMSEIYLAEVPNASVLGWHDIVLTQNRRVAMYDMPTIEGASRRIVCEHWSIRYLSKDQVLLDGFYSAEKAFNNVVMFAGRGRDSYAHWVVDFLSKYSILERHTQYDGWPLLIDEGLYPQQIEALRFLAGSRPLIPLKHNYLYDVDRLVLISDLSHMRRQSYRPNTLPTCDEALVSPFAISYLRKKFGIEKTDKPVRKIYVSRKFQKAFRQLVNEEDIEAIFANHGFEIIYPEKLGFFEQIRIFSEAGVIAGSAGSNMINAIFAPAQAKILMLARWSPKINYYFFSYLAQLNGQELLYVLGETAGHSAVHYQSDFFVSPEKVEAGIRSLIA